MLGVALLFVGIVLISNGMCRLYNVDGKAQSVMNIFTGGITLILNVVSIIRGDYYSGATGLLFTFTYLYVAINGIFNLNPIPYGWFSLFVAINTLPAGYLSLKSDWRMSIIWWLWGVLWLTGWIETVPKKNLGKFTPVLAVFEGIVTAWIPGFLMLIDMW